MSLSIIAVDRREMTADHRVAPPNTDQTVFSSPRASAVAYILKRERSKVHGCGPYQTLACLTTATKTSAIILAQLDELIHSEP